MENMLEPGDHSQLITWTSTNRSPLFTDSLDLWPQETTYKTRPLRAPPTVRHPNSRPQVSSPSPHLGRPPV